MKGLRILAVSAIMASLALSACGKKEEEKAISPHETGEIPLDQQYSMPGPAEVMIPDDVKGSWSGINIELTNSETGERETVAVEIGKEKQIEGTSVRIKVLSFLPAFQMDGPIITSRSNEPENPAAQIEIYEGDSQLFKGWLFTLYPTTHAFTHPKYSITLLDGVPAKEETAKK